MGTVTTYVEKWEQSLENKRIFKGILLRNFPEYIDSVIEPELIINAKVEVRLEKYYGDCKIYFSGKSSGSNVTIDGLVSGYTPLSMTVGHYVYEDEDDDEGEYKTLSLVNNFEYQGGIWRGYNLVNNISTGEYSEFTLLLKHPNGIEEKLEIYQDNIFIEGQKSGDLYLEIDANVSGSKVFINDYSDIISDSNFTPVQLIQNIDGEDVILVQGFSGKSSEVDSYYLYTGKLIQSIVDPNTNDNVGEPYLLLSESVLVNQSEYTPGDDPQYSEPTLYLGQDSATLLLEDSILSHRLTKIGNAYQIIDNNWTDIANSFENREDFIYDGQLGSEYTNGTSTDIITLVCNDLSVSDYPDPHENDPDFYYDPNNLSTGDTVAVKLNGNLKWGSPGDVYAIINDEEIKLVSSGNWTDLGGGLYTFTGVLENDYSDGSEVRAQILVNDEYTGIMLDCNLVDEAYVPPTPTKCYIGNNQYGNTITIQLGTHFSYLHPEVNLEDLTVGRVYDSEDSTIAYSFISQGDGIFEGTLDSPVDDPSSNGYVELHVDDEEPVEFIEPVLFIEEDFNV